MEKELKAMTKLKTKSAKDVKATAEHNMVKIIKQLERIIANIQDRVH